uniref:Exosome complex component RRP45 n=1 Tax=Anopheles dirus TaxID=7168 RepID=A0A182N4M5_9DIPT
MKERVLTNNEKSFVQKAIMESIRVDGRNPDEFRKLRITFGSEWGMVHVVLGETRALARVTCEVVEPKATRPNEGMVFVNVELGPMAAPNFDGGRQSDESVQLNRILERALKDSGCVDLESLCLVSEEKVWNLRIDVTVLNHEGNAIDCCSIAALTALAHFKRPDITVDGENVIVHTMEEKEPIKVTLFHYPICVSYAIFNQGKVAIADPTYLEERVAEAKMVFGINSYGELCGLHLGGTTLTSADLLMRTSMKAAKRARLVVEKIKAAIEKDGADRDNGLPVGFTEGIERNESTVHAQDRMQVRLKRFKLKIEGQDRAQSDEEEEYIDEVTLGAKKEATGEGSTQNQSEEPMAVDDSDDVLEIGENAAVLVPTANNKSNQWLTEEELVAVKEESDKKSSKSGVKRKKKNHLSTKKETNTTQEILDDSSEEETVTLTSAFKGRCSNAMSPNAVTLTETDKKLTQFRNCRVLRNHQLVQDDVWVRGGKVIDPEKVFFDEKLQADVQVDCGGCIIAPGFIDLQINGGYGVDFSFDVQTVEAGVLKVAKGLLAHGVTSFCPTLVTSPAETYHAVLPRIPRHGGGKHGATVLGCHVEGPFINANKKGAHPPECIKEFDQGIATVREVYGSMDNVQIVTLAPEKAGASEVIQELSNNGITVSVGHSMANLSDGEVAVRHGARLITHLFNAMLPFHHRDPGLVGLLTTDNIPRDALVYFGIISDGVHTHPAALRIAYKTHPNGLILVTDAISAMGLAEGRHRIGQMEIEIRAGRAYVAGTNTLCGSIAPMDECIRFFKKAS